MTAHGHLVSSSLPVGAAARPYPGARAALFLLIAINMFNFLDRQVLAAVEPEIRREYLEGRVPDPEFWSGLLATAFLVTYMFIAPVFGWLADHISRWVLVAFGVLIWSLASGASGLDWLHWLGLQVALGYWLLFLTRCLVGVGEGAYGPVAPTMLADYYPVQQRGQVMSWFYMAIPVGGALGYTLGDIVKDIPGMGWRWAFYLVVPPGLLLGLLCFLMREPARGQAEEVVDTVPRKADWHDYLDLLKIPSYVLNLLGMTCLMFAIGALAYWMPKFLEVRQVPALGPFGPRMFFGMLTALSGLAATLLGGLAGDWLKRYHGGSYFLVSGVSMLLGFPMVLLAVWLPFPWAWLFIFLGVFSLFFNTAPTNTIVANVTHPSVRASGFAFNILLTHLFGDAISPPLVGAVTAQANIETGFAVVSLAMLVGGILWIWGAFYLERDTALAPTRLRVKNTSAAGV